MSVGMRHTNIYMKKWNKLGFTLTGIALLLSLVAASLLYGNSSVSASSILDALFDTRNADLTIRMILYDIRLPRVLAAIVCGAGLSVSGLLLQEALGNNLASPSVMGVTNGAGLFVLLSAILFGNSVLAKSFMSFIGAFLTIAIVFVISRYAGSAKSTLILSGVATSALMSAGINLAVVIKPDAVYDKIAFQLGSLANVHKDILTFSAVLMIIALGITILLSKGIELFPLGDDVAHELGMPVRKYRLITLILSVLFASAAVSVCGLISFVGLIVPNLVREISKAGFADKLIISAIWGSNLILAGDILAKNTMYPYELPVGMLISLLGAPFFIVLIAKKRRRG